MEHRSVLILLRRRTDAACQVFTEKLTHFIITYRLEYITQSLIIQVNDDGVNLLSVGKDERTPNETGSVLEPPTSYPFYQNASNVADLLADGQSFSDCESFECDAHPLFVCCGYELIPRVLPLYL